MSESQDPKQNPQPTPRDILIGLALIVTATLGCGGLVGVSVALGVLTFRFVLGFGD